MAHNRTAYVFPGANTAVGYRSFFGSALSGLDNVFILKGGPGCGKSTLIRRISDMMLQRGLEVELWQCSADLDSLDGVVIKSLSAAVVDGTPPHIVEPRYPGAVEELVDLGQCWRAAELKRQRQRIMQLGRQSGEHYRQCRLYLAQAAQLLPGAAAEGDSRVKPNITDDSLTDKGKLHLDDDIGETNPPLDLSRLFSRVFGAAAGCRHLFASSITPRGWVSFLEPLSQRAGRRLILCGPYGQGKERLLRQLAAEARRRRVYIELFHHPLAPNELQMLRLPGLDLAVLAVEEAPPQRAGDELINCGQARQQDQERRQQLLELVARAGEQIAQAKALHDELETCYAATMDYSLVEESGARLLSRLLALPVLEQQT